MRKNKSDFKINQELLHKMFNYNPLSGDLTNREGFRNRVLGESAIKHLKRGSAPIVNIYGNSYQVGRIIWIHFYGYEPEHNVRFISRDYSDTTIKNLCVQIKGEGELPSKEELRKYLNYESSTGIMTWTKLPPFGSRQRIGNQFGCQDKNQFRMVAGFNNHQRQLTSFIWCYMTGDYPKEGFVIDHKNGDPMDNSWENLREVTQQQNLGNLTRNRKNTKYLRGVAKNYYGKFHMRCVYKGIKYGGKVRDTQEEAHQDYIELHKKLHGQYSNYV